MIGSYIAFIAITLLAMMGLDSVPLMMLAAFAASIIVTSAFGYSIERVAYRPLRGGNRLIPLISAIGMSIFLQNAVMLSQDSKRKGHPDPAARQLRVRRKQHERRGDLLYADPDLRRHLPGDVRPHPVHLPLSPGPRLPRLRRGPEDDQPAGYQQQQHHRPHLRHRRRPGRRRRGAAGHAVRRDQPRDRLPRRDQGVHRRGARRHRQHPRRHARRPAAGRRRSLRRRRVRRPVQGRGGLRPADPGAAVPTYRHPRSSGGGKV